MTLDDIRTLVDYHYWANARLFAAVDLLSAEAFTRDLGGSFPSVRDTLSHLHSAEWVWVSRLQGAAPTAHLPHERFPDPASVRAAWTATEADLRACVAGLDEAGLARPLEYRTLGGGPSRTPVGQILQHLVNHGTHHRGQVTTMLRQLAAKPPAPLDLIFFYRR